MIDVMERLLARGFTITVKPEDEEGDFNVVLHRGGNPINGYGKDVPQALLSAMSFLIPYPEVEKESE